MGFWKRIFGICDTGHPKDPNCWQVEGGAIRVDLECAPEIHEPGSAIRLEGSPLSERFLLVHGTDGTYHAFKNRCTHMGRRIDPFPGTDRLRCCSVSKSTFDYGGTVVAGPANGPLKSHAVRRDGHFLLISLD